MVWENWSGSLRFEPGDVAEPGSADELAALVRYAGENGRSVRVVGSGHSSVPLVRTDETLVSLSRLTGVVEADAGAHEATVLAGTTLKDMGVALLEHGLAPHNLGDVDVQAAAGAVGTGTHGTGRRLKDVSSMLIGMKMVTGSGEVLDVHEDDDPDLLRAARVSFGSLGILTHLRVRLQPAYELHRREWCSTAETAMVHLDELIERHRNFDFYWYPRSDEVKLRTMDLPGDDPPVPFATCVKDETGPAAEIIARTRTLRFDEMEYALPLDAAPRCFAEVRERIRERWRTHVGWRVLYRTIAADDTWLSNAYWRDTATISLHHNNTLPFWEFFSDIEPIFLAYGGRPHWGKKHSLTAEQLRPLYPMWDRFAETRRRFDPDGVLLNPYLRLLLGEGAADDGRAHLAEATEGASAWRR